MFERYNEGARRVVFYARYEVSEHGSSPIGTEHLLLGLVREDKALLSRFLPAEVSSEVLRGEIEASMDKAGKVPTSVEIPLSEESKRVLWYAAAEAEVLSHGHIGTEHLLLGLLREEKSPAAQVLQQNGVTYTEVRRAVRDWRPE